MCWPARSSRPRRAAGATPPSARRSRASSTPSSVKTCSTSCSVPSPRLSSPLGDGTLHEVEHVFTELGVDEALDLLALGGVAPAARLGRELRAGQHIEEREQAGVRARVRARELL